MLEALYTRRPSRFKRIVKTLAIAGVLSLMSAEAMRAVGRRTLARELAAWNAAGVRSYVYRYRAVCFCPGSGKLYRVDVRDGRVISAAAVEPTSTPYAWQLDEHEHPTVDSLFRLASRAYERRAQTVRVRYDRTHHYPIEIVINESYLAVDDALTLTAGELAPSPPVPVARR